MNLRQRVRELVTATGASSDVVSDKQRDFGGGIGMKDLAHRDGRTDAVRGFRCGR
jgi:hypothetical protein